MRVWVRVPSSVPINCNIMPRSYPIGKKEVQDFIRHTLPVSSTILDVGPGAGVYSDLLSPHGYVLDCVEIFEPYVAQFSLLKKYRSVFVEDVRNFDVGTYDFVIFGDVLEHMEVSDAQRLIGASKKCLVAVPYQYVQGAVYGNEAERHIQDDLTPALMQERYPALNVILSNEHYGYYVK